MPRIPLRFAPFVYGALQAVITTGIATAIALHIWSDIDFDHIYEWLIAWSASWLLIMPFVLICSPFIQKCVMAMTIDARDDD